MTVNSLTPKFIDRKSYNAWRDEWRIVYKELSKNITKAKHETKNAQKNGTTNAPSLQSNLHYDRVIAHKMMSLLEEGKLRMKRIYEMEKQIKTQMDSFPITLECRVLDFHFNRVHTEFPFMPMWTVKARGKQFFINHFSADGVPWSTRELPDAKSTKGMLRFKQCSLHIDKDGNATISTIPKSDPVMIEVDVSLLENNEKELKAA